MKNCIVVHGIPDHIEKSMDSKTRTYDKHWIPWIKKELISRGIPTQTPLMPTPWNPNYSAFKGIFETCTVTEDSILIGHSGGGSFLVRWLGDTKQLIHKLILVAPWKIPDKKNPEKKAFYEYPIDTTIPSRVKEIIMFTSDNEHKDGKSSLEIYHRVLGGRIINLTGHGHYLFKDMGTEEFPELLDEITKGI